MAVAAKIDPFTVENETDKQSIWSLWLRFLTVVGRLLLNRSLPVNGMEKGLANFSRLVNIIRNTHAHQGRATKWENRLRFPSHPPHDRAIRPRRCIPSRRR
jgi:hypothetical protein